MLKINTPVIDYRNFRFSKLNTTEFSHLKLLFFWPLFLLVFQYAEHLYQVDYYHSVHSQLDDCIPFNEWFVIPYMFWFLYLVGMHLYTLLHDVDSFRRLMRFIIITYTVAVLTYFIFPTCQDLRPAEFERDNILTRFMAGFYRFDTNTNVCPSIHVIGSVAVWAAGWNAPNLQKIRWKFGFVAATILICLSTVFLKQHSVVDIIAALPICVIAYWICYRRKSADVHKPFGNDRMSTSSRRCIRRTVYEKGSDADRK
ncbi:MAG: phosphatase PAP2 family protein [Clostridia bacterium]|nr:phosphatase PAP2 family protein [Clostridia bacterium]